LSGAGSIPLTQPQQIAGPRTGQSLGAFEEQRIEHLERPLLVAASDLAVNDVDLVY